jgi:hypothetical protein
MGCSLLIGGTKMGMDVRIAADFVGRGRHYDGHDYLLQKRQALELLFNLLESEPQSKVVRMKKHRA